MAQADFFWSQQARQDFSLLFDDGYYSERFRDAVAEALTRGWSNNKDKPFWALALLIGVIGAASKDASGSGTKSGDGLDLVCMSANEIWHKLKIFVSSGPEGKGWRVIPTGTGLRIEAPDGGFVINPTRLALLQKIAQFFFSCDNYEYAREMMELCQALAKTGLDDHDAVKSTGRAFSRLAYRYRTGHFEEGHSSSGFSVIKKFLVQRQNEIDDEAIFEFWVWDENDKYKTYKSVFFAFADFYASLTQAMLMNSAASAIDVDDPVIQSELSLITAANPADGDRETEPASQSTLLSLADAAPDAESSAQSHTAPLGQTPLRLFKQAELKMMDSLFEIGDFGRKHSLAALRLLAFHPIQSSISNSLRTGRSKIPLHRRVTCEEAAPYAEIRAELDQLAERTASWLKVAFTLKSAPDAEDEKIVQIRDAGDRILKMLGSKFAALDKDTLRSSFETVEDALIKSHDVIAQFARMVEKRHGSPPEALEGQFDDDKQRFAEIFRKTYMTEQPHPAEEKTLDEDAEL